MANTLKLKRSSTASDTPSASDLEVGEIAVNTADGKLFTKHTDNSIKELGGGSGSGGDVVDDTSPQLGGDLDVNDKKILFDSTGGTGPGNDGTEVLKFKNTELYHYDSAFIFYPVRVFVIKNPPVSGEFSAIIIDSGVQLNFNINGLTKLFVQSTLTTNYQSLDLQHASTVTTNHPELRVGIDYASNRGIKLAHDRSGNSNAGLSVLDNRSGDLEIQQYADDRHVVIKNDDGAGGLTNYFKADGSNGETSLYHLGDQTLVTKNYGVEVRGDSNNGSGAVQLNCEQNTHGVKIKGPAHSAAANYTLTLPTGTGSDGQVLKTDGSGNLSWVANSGGGGSSGPTISTGVINYIDTFFNLASDWKCVELVVANTSNTTKMGPFYVEYGITGVDTTISFNCNRIELDASPFVDFASGSSDNNFDNMATGGSLSRSGVFFARLTRHLSGTTHYISMESVYPDVQDRFEYLRGTRAIAASSNQNFIKVYRGSYYGYTQLQYAIRTWT